MTDPTHLGFLYPHRDIHSTIYVPKYYDPEIARRLEELKDHFQLLSIGDLVHAGELSVLPGRDVGNINYGTGPIPFVRTSDIATWEVAATPKQGVSEEVYNLFAKKQDVRPDDLLFVRDGTYLIGNAAIVRSADLPLVFQSHILKLRCAEDALVDPFLLLLLLSAPIVRAQIRAKQFTAGIIDKIEDRYLEVQLPIPRTANERRSLAEEIRALVDRRVELREVLRRIPLWAQGLMRSPTATTRMPEAEVEVAREFGFVKPAVEIGTRPLIPKYYNPGLDRALRRLGETFRLVTLGELAEQGIVEAETGIEVGKLAYGTGPVPFVRTSDLANWELRGDPKQKVSEALYKGLAGRVDVRDEDILVVRDGTYLVGTSAIITASDSHFLYAGGLYKVRVLDRHVLDPYLLIALLNTPIVKAQMRSKQFTRDIIDTLGKRLFELVLPIPRSLERREQIAARTKAAVVERAELRERARSLVSRLEPPSTLSKVEREAVAASSF